MKSRCIVQNVVLIVFQGHPNDCQKETIVVEYSSLLFSAVLWLSEKRKSKRHQHQSERSQRLNKKQSSFSLKRNQIPY